MEQVSAERRAIAKRVMRAMRFSMGREPLAGLGEDGAQHIVVCLRDDSLQYASDMVRQAGGLATVVVPASDRPGLIPLVWRDVIGGQGADGSVTDISPVSTMGLLCDFLTARTETDEFTFRLTFPEFDAEIVERDVLTVPA